MQADRPFTGAHEPSRLVSFLLVGAFFFLVFLLLFGLNMQRGLDHDEHMYVAAGKLLADRSLLPYRDYHYLHLPNLTFAYAFLFLFTDHLLLAGRTFSVLCALGTLGVIFAVAFGLFRGQRYWVRFLIAAGSVVLIAMNPVFIFTSGRAWNHDPSVLLALLAFVLLAGGARRRRPGPWVFLSGLCLGLAVGTRASFALGIVPFLALVWLHPHLARRGRQVPMLLAFGGGVGVSLLPAFFLWTLAPGRFWFDNVGFQHFNTLYRQAVAHQRAMTALGKLSFFRDVLSDPGNLVLSLAFVACVGSVGPRGLRGRLRRCRRVEVLFVLILLPFLLMGAFAPTPSWYQYFYAPIPFVVLGILYAIASVSDRRDRVRRGLAVLAVAAVVSAVYGLPSYRHVGGLWRPDEWFPVRVHRIGVGIKAAVGGGRVLTLAPLYPLEGGADIYAEFAAGPFVWRVAPLVPEPKRREFNVIAEAELGPLLAARPARAVLLGFEGRLEEPFVDYAKANASGRGVLTLDGVHEGAPEWGGVPPLLDEAKRRP